MPPASLCLVDDFCFRYVSDMGIAGPTGEGGQVPVPPAGYEGAVPDRYTFTRARSTPISWPLALSKALPAIEQVKIYPLSQADAPPGNEFVNLSQVCMNLVHANDFTFYQEVNELVQEEPTGALDAERAGQLAAIGIVKGKPFEPDPRLRAILERAAPIGAGISRAIAYAPRDSEAALDKAHSAMVVRFSSAPSVQTGSPRAWFDGARRG